MLLLIAARDNWKKQYFEEKKKTLPLEEHATKMRREVDNLNRRLISRLEKEADSKQDHAQQLSVSPLPFHPIFTYWTNFKAFSIKIERRRINCETPQG